VYLIIGATWGGYAFFKKTASLDAFSGLFLETALLSLLLCIAVPVSSLSFKLPEALPLAAISLLTICGLVSLIPLWLFSYAAKNLALSVMGFFQFILPTTQLVIALLFYHQPISNNTLICFSIIWTALLLIVMESFIGSLRLGALIPLKMGAQ
jgi:chloramphenicol-sensitive protein RarD